MPPSPSLRWSPSRDTPPQLVTHKRGHSFESGLLAREKDDDLALFNEVQNKEQDNFLLHSTDDLDDSLSTNLRYFSDFKLGINIPARGETSDLLNANADKNDYDWLLTPPETPLFSSLDDEVPSINLPHRGRPRSQPISIPRPTTTEKSNRASRSSASPHRLSPSPRSSSNSLQSRGRPLSVPLSTPILRPTTPSRSPSRSTTPSKPSTPAQRSTTPTPRRMSTGSSVTVASSGRTGTSPVKTNRGNSASPKLRAWQSNIPGFSTDVPPNLRTSLEDRPASYVRGSSPASRNGRGSSPSSNNGRGLSPVSSNARGLSPASRNGRESSSKRQSMSPTASRSASSSCSHDRDQFSSRSKGSIASSGDDDIDSLQSFSVSVSENLAVKKGGFPSSRGQVFSKKPSKVLSSSAPKRSFDSALRQMDRRSPQNMFRPLLSSVPSTTFYAGKASSSHRPVISRNSSITTSSTASSEQGASFIRDNESSDHDQDHGDKGKESCPDVHDEVFIFDKVDEMNEAVGHEFDNENSNVAHEYSTTNKSETNSGESENFTQEIVCAEVGSESTSVQDELSGTSCQVNLITCSKCGRNFSVIPPIEEYDDMCPHCIEKGRCPPLASSDTPVVNRSSTMHSEVTEKSESFAELGSEKSLPKLPDLSILNEAVLAQDETNDGKEHSLSDGKIMVEGENHGADRKVLEQLAEGSNQPTSDLVDQQPLLSDGHQSFNVDVSQGVGISVLLKSSSSKWPVVQGRTFTASDDLSYTRESLNSMRSSVGHGSVSTSSSVDLSSSRQTDTRFQRQLSCRKSDRENSRHGSGTHIKPLSRGSSFSGTSNHTHHALVFDMSTSEENFDVLTGKMDFEALEETQAVTEEKGRHAELDSSVATAVYEKNKLDCTESCEIMDAPAQEPLSHTLSIRLMDTSVSMFPDDDCSISSANADELKNNASISDIEVSTLNQDRLPMDEEAILNDVACRDHIGENPAHDSSIIVSEEVEMDPECAPGSQNEKECSPTPINTVDDLQELSVPTSSEKDTPVSASESCITDPAHDILEESTVTIRDPGGHNSRSLTLEEATDTILFCSSIIHDLAYQAAAIGMEKENLLSLEGSRPTVTILGKSSPSRKDRGRSINKRSPRLSKSKQKRVETTEVRPASPKTETDIKIHRSVPHDSEVPNRVDSVRPLNPESKCNCTVM